MKLLFFSDIHGVPGTLRQVFGHANALAADRLILLGDALCPGPRGGVPEEYDVPEVARLLNSRKRSLLAVRGNCDTEADRRLLEFPITAEYAEIVAGKRQFFLTHGHRFNVRNVPPVPDGAVLAHGHTHIPEITRIYGITIFNPGSISLPKGGFPRSFGFFDGEKLSVCRLDDGSVLFAES